MLRLTMLSLTQTYGDNAQYNNTDGGLTWFGLLSQVSQPQHIHIRSHLYSATQRVLVLCVLQARWLSWGSWADVLRTVFSSLRIYALSNRNIPLSISVFVLVMIYIVPNIVSPCAVNHILPTARKFLILRSHSISTLYMDFSILHLLMVAFKNSWKTMC